MLVVFEGMDGSGKTTHAKLLQQHIESKYPRKVVKAIKLPDHTSLSGRTIRDYLGGRWWTLAPTGERGDAEEQREALLQQSLQVVNRIECLPRESWYGLEEDPDHIWLLDRYVMSGIVYGRAAGLDAEWLHSINQLFPKPQLTYVLTMPVAEFKTRRGVGDVYESEAMLRKVKALYARESEDTEHYGRVVNINTSASSAQVTQDCIRGAFDMFVADHVST